MKSVMLSAFAEYHRRPMVDLAHKITSAELQTMSLGGSNEIHDQATMIINGQLITFTYSQKVNAGDFICYANESDIYHCPKAVFDERHYQQGEVVASSIHDAVLNLREAIQAAEPFGLVRTMNGGVITGAIDSEHGVILVQ
ncbi:hypothetical protein ACPV5G_20420 [Photobacterium damselae]|uniref:hypothetical protein n=1 Tax=Photobacterium damselae TaxID=38293 RepID=UPI004067D2AF